jgi:hypothetical protein
MLELCNKVLTPPRCLCFIERCRCQKLLAGGGRKGDSGEAAVDKCLSLVPQSVRPVDAALHCGSGVRRAAPTTRRSRGRAVA